MKFRFLPALGAAVALAACESLAPLRDPAPAEYYDTAYVPGLPGARGWGDDFDVATSAALTKRVAADITADWIAAGRPAEGVRRNLLALSGGGPDGAYGAGLLSGWTMSGTRPQFDVVTGVSVGGLIAPFAFVGSDYDAALRMIFTELGSDDVAVLQIFNVLRGALGVADTQPLRANIRALVDEPFLREVAKGHREGRRLLILTTNIDAARPVIWNMGAIAEAGDLDLFQDVMLASASIPGAFPPVGFEVTNGSRSFTEFHVDGGVTRSVFIGPTGAGAALPRDFPFPVNRTIYVIQNNSLAPPYSPVESRLQSIATRSLSTLIRGQSEGDLERIYHAAEISGSEFRLTFVPPSFIAASTTSFDRDYMRALFQYAYEDALDGIDWLEEPPGLQTRTRLEREIRASMSDRIALAPGSAR